MYQLTQLPPRSVLKLTVPGRTVQMPAILNYTLRISKATKPSALFLTAQTGRIATTTAHLAMAETEVTYTLRLISANIATGIKAKVELNTT